MIFFHRGDNAFFFVRLRFSVYLFLFTALLMPKEGLTVQIEKCPFRHRFKSHEIKLSKEELSKQGHSADLKTLFVITKISARVFAEICITKKRILRTTANALFCDGAYGKTIYAQISPKTIGDILIITEVEMEGVGIIRPIQRCGPIVAKQTAIINLTIMIIARCWNKDFITITPHNSPTIDIIKCSSFPITM